MRVFIALIALYTTMATARSWEGIVIHHSASPEWTTVQDIDAWHRERGFTGVGYHYVIEHSGRIRVGRPIDQQGAHAKTGKSYSRNATHIGICLVGNESFTEVQLVSLRRLVKRLRQAYPIVSVEPHHEECAGHGVPSDIFEWLP